MMKDIFIFTLLLLVVAPSFSQNNCTITGKIMDKSGPVEFATIELYSSADTLKIVKGNLSDSLGRFVLSELAQGSYIIEVRMLGYQPLKTNVQIPKQKKEIDVGIITIETDSYLLAGVTVTSQKALIKKTTEGFVINAKDNITQAGGTATDILKNTPTVVVDAEGTITLRGKSPLIMVNGRNSNFSNPNLIPASSIESIEIINNATSKYDANAESGIINIILKKSSSSGTNGAFSVGFGEGAKGRLSSSAQLNHKSKKLNFGISYDNRFAGRTRNINGNRTNFFITDAYYLDQYRSDSREERLQNLRINLDFSPDDKNTISLEAIGGLESQDNLEDLNTLLLKKGNIFNSNTDRYSAEYQKEKLAEFALNYERNFTDKRKSLTAVISTSLSNDKENTDITSQSKAENNTFLGDPVLERTHNFEKGNITIAKMDYGFQMSENFRIETGYKGTFRSIVADYENALKLNNNYVINTDVSNIFNFNEYVNALYVLFANNSESATWSYNFGLRAENVSNEGHTENSSTQFTNQYLKLFPNGSLTYNLSETNNIKLSYGKRINRPGLGQLNPFTDVTDALNPHSGNPNLKPEIIHAIELGYGKEWSNAIFSSNAFFRHSLNTIRSYYQLQPNGVNLSLPVNIGSASTYGLENIFNYKSGTKYNLVATVSLFQQKINGENVDQSAVQNAFGWNSQLINNLTAFKNGKIQVLASYNSALTTPQGKRLEQYFMDFGYQHKFGEGNARVGLTLIDVFNTLRSGYVNSTTEFTNSRSVKADTRALMLTFAWTFKSAFKEKLLDNKFSKEY
ncbi:MAG: TonB-dependent receptor [Saprospiraceae bacterium]